MNYDITQTTTTDLTNTIADFSVEPKNTDTSQGYGEKYWDNKDFKKWYGYYAQIPEIKSIIDRYADWVLGRGYEVKNPRNKVVLDHITGWGEDTFLAILWNMLVVKKFNGDAYAEIVRDKKGMIQNIKVLDPSTMRTVTNPAGKVIRYEQRTTGQEPKIFQPDEILHFCNNRVADNIHGQSIIEPVEWTLVSINESLADKRRMLHRSTIRIMEVDENDKTRLTQLKTDYAEAISQGEVLLVPKGTGQIQDLVPPSTEHMEWVKYLENRLYQILGIPRVVLGGTSDSTEASAKVGVVVFEPVFTREISELQMDILNQLGIEITINKQPSLMDNMQTDEAKNTGQTKLEYQGSQ